MTYALWHSGIKIGETDFAHDDPAPNPRHRAGVFHGTSYGMRIFPRLSGVLTAGAGIKQDVEERGLVPEQMDPEEVIDFLETTDSGRRFIDIGRMLSEVEIRDPRGRTLEFTQIAFIDLEELRALTERPGVGQSPDELPSDLPRYIVSATLKSASDWDNTVPITFHA